MCLHHNNLDWKKYINNAVKDRSEYEQALASCTSCFQEYMLLLEVVSEDPPPGFTDKVMGAITKDDCSRTSAFKPYVHFLVAACLTLIFIELGAFDWIGSRQLTPDADTLSGFLESFSDIIGTLKINLGGM